jgi:roadblock/LC7 domain-containing protein
MALWDLLGWMGRTWYSMDHRLLAWKVNATHPLAAATVPMGAAEAAVADMEIVGAEFSVVEFSVVVVC